MATRAAPERLARPLPPDVSGAAVSLHGEGAARFREQPSRCGRRHAAEAADPMLRREISLSLPSTPGKYAHVAMSDEQPQRQQKRLTAQSVPQSPISGLPNFSSSSSNPSSPKARPIVRRHLVLYGSADAKVDKGAAASSLLNDSEGAYDDDDYDDEDESTTAVAGGADADAEDEGETTARLLMLLGDGSSAGSKR